MSISHETINSIGVVVAVVLGLSNSFQHHAAIPVIERISLDRDKTKILIEKDRMFIEQHKEGLIKVLNSGNKRAFVSVKIYAAPACNTKDKKVVFYENGYLDPESAYKIVTLNNEILGSSEILPEQVFEIPWAVTLKYPPDFKGELCAITTTMLSDGTQFWSEYSVGSFWNEFDINSIPIEKDYQVPLQIQKTLVLRNGEESILTVEEEKYLVKKPDGKTLERMLTHLDSQYSYDMKLLFPEVKLVPERNCLTLLNFEKCWKTSSN